MSELTTRGLVSMRMVEVTPAVAEAWLGKNVHNRNPSPAMINSYARDMAAGRWAQTGEAIKFDLHGNLIDGQHRLHAVIRAGVPVVMLIIEGLDGQSQEYMDRGKTRSAGDSLELRGYANSKNLAALAGLALTLTAVKAGRHTKEKWTHPEVVAWVEANPDAAAIPSRSASLSKKIALRPAALAWCLLMFNRLDSEACAEFFDSLAHGSTDGKGDPRSALLQRLASAQRNRERMSVANQVDMVVRAWNAWRSGEEMRQIKLGRLGDPVAIPV